MLTTLLCRALGHRWDWRMARDADDRVISYFQCLRCGQMNELTKDAERHLASEGQEAPAAPEPTTPEADPTEAQTQTEDRLADQG